jgi:non-specific serine/threonine protein kinase
LAQQAYCAIDTIKKIESGVRRPSRQLAEVLADLLALVGSERMAFVQAARSLPPPDAPDNTLQSLVPESPTDRLPQHNIPLTLTSFIGREAECAAIAELLTSQRLVTLTGSGGTGKTRLAFQVAMGVQNRFPHGIWLVELAPLTDPALVLQAVASVLGLREEADRSLLVVLSDYLRSRTLLLVLDNCEHLVDACAYLAEALLRVCSQIHILASSREALGIAGEAPFRVPPLSTPDLRKLPDRDAFRQYEAVRLFTERAMSVLPKFQVTDENMMAVAQVCARLDGIPLAIELAAARITMLRVEQIAARLDDRFRLLTGVSRTALPRQQTLRALIDWSYDLLSQSEQQLLHRLAVFVGGWTLEAAQAVAAEGSQDSYDLLDQLTRLVDKSLVVAERTPGQDVRYHLLETIRQYAEERLVASGQAESVRDMHLSFFTQFAETFEQKFQGKEHLEWCERVISELGNIRIALDWSLHHGDIMMGMRLVSALWLFYNSFSYENEALQWLSAFLAHPNAQQATWVRGRALHAASHLDHVRGNHLQARAFGEEALDLARALGDQITEIETLCTISNIAAVQGNYEEAYTISIAALIIARTSGNQWQVGMALDSVGYAALFHRQYQSAQSAFEESTALFHALGQFSLQSNNQRMLGYALMHQQDYQRAALHYHESLKLNAAFEEMNGVVCSLAALAGVALLSGGPTRAARLCGAAIALLETTASQHMSTVFDRIEYEHVLQALTAQLDEATFNAAWAEGRALTLEQAMAEALNATPPVSA